jgi:hypothetical protein
MFDNVTWSKIICEESIANHNHEPEESDFIKVQIIVKGRIDCINQLFQSVYYEVTYNDNISLSTTDGCYALKRFNELVKYSEAKQDKDDRTTPNQGW